MRRIQYRYNLNEYRISRSYIYWSIINLESYVSFDRLAVPRGALLAATAGVYIRSHYVISQDWLSISICTIAIYDIHSLRLYWYLIRLIILDLFVAYPLSLLYLPYRLALVVSSLLFLSSSISLFLKLSFKVPTLFLFLSLSFRVCWFFTFLD